MDKQWFVLHTLTGQEQKAQRSIDARVKLERMEDFIGKCVIPTERLEKVKFCPHCRKHTTHKETK